jgi:branched-chain amino acid transport system substrate-binding protein
MQLALDEMQPELRKRINVVLDDDQLKGAQAVNSYSALRRAHDLKSVFVFAGSSVAAIAPIADKDQVPLFAVTFNREIIAGRKFSSILYVVSAELTKLVTDRVISQGNTRRIAVISTQHEAIKRWVLDVKSSLTSGGAQISFEADTLPGDTDFRSILTRLRSTDSQAVALCVLPPSLVAFATQYREQRIELPLLACPVVENVADVRASKGALDDTIFSSQPAEPEFAKRYGARFGADPEIGAANAYDAVNLFARAVASGASSGADFLKAYQETTGYQGALGELTYIPGEQRFSVIPRLRAIKDGKFVDLD